VRPAYRYGDDTPTSPGLEITRTTAVWFWLWGPLLAAVVVVSFLAGMASAPVSLPLPPEAHPASIVDVRGRPLTTVEPPASAEQVPSEQLPDLLLRAIVAVQDPGYFSRRGLSASDLLAAGASDLVRVPRHGSTIEERYVRQVRIAAGSNLPSLRESTVAVRLSQRLSRRGLLTRYVNGMYFGNGVYGVAAAARFYFGQPVDSLDAAQSALLAGIADDPSRTNPITAPALAIEGQHRAVTAMSEAGLLTPATAAAALREPVDARAHRQLERPSPAPDFTALVESSLLSRFGDDVVYGQALRVTTPLDLDLQSALVDAVREAVPTNVPAVLAVATDPRTGDVRALLNRSPSSSATKPDGAADVLFARRPLGTLAGELPGPVGDGRSASLGEVASAAGSIVAGGAWHDLRPLIGVVRRASAGQSTVVLDAADPLPAGRQFLPVDRATAAMATSRSASRIPGSPSADLPFALTALRGLDEPGTADAVSTATGSAASTSAATTSAATTSATSSPADPHWFVGCVPDLCVTVWTSPGNSTTGTAATSADPAETIAVDTFRRYVAAAPDRIDLPALPQPRVELRRPAPTTTVTPAPTVTATPSAAATPTPTPTAAKPKPSVIPSVRPPAGGATPATPSPSPSASGSSPGGSGSEPVAAGGPPAASIDGRT
jgi:membrane peptidoglycan carboxypeptidase